MDSLVCFVDEVTGDTLGRLFSFPTDSIRHMKASNYNSLIVAKYLQNHSKVSSVSYAGLKNNKYYNLGKKYFPYGVGSIFTVKLKNGYKACVSMVEKANLLSHVANVGDTRSLIIHPASTTHSQLSDTDKMNLQSRTRKALISVLMIPVKHL